MLSDLITYLNSKIPSLTVYPLHIPQKASLPACVYTSIDREHSHNLAGSAGLCREHLQFDFYSTSFSVCVSQAEAVRNELDGFKGTMGSTLFNGILLEREFDLYDQPIDATDVGTFHRSSEYLFVYQESLPTLS